MKLCHFALSVLTFNFKKSKVIYTKMMILVILKVQFYFIISYQKRKKKGLLYCHKIPTFVCCFIIGWWISAVKCWLQINLMFTVVSFTLFPRCSSFFMLILLDTELHGRFTRRAIADWVERGGQPYIHDRPGWSSFLWICAPMINFDEIASVWG